MGIPVFELYEILKREPCRMIGWAQEGDWRWTAEEIDGACPVDQPDTTAILPRILYFLQEASWAENERDWKEWVEDCKNLGSSVFAVKESISIYELAFRVEKRIADYFRSQYEGIVQVNLRFADITLKAPNINTLIQCFREISDNPIVVYDEFFHVVTSTDEYLNRYERVEDTMERCELTNLFYYKQLVRFSDADAPQKECIRLLFPVLLNDMAKGYLAIFDVKTRYEVINFTILEFFANSALVEMKRLLDLQNIEEKYISDFLYDLIYRKENKREEIKRRAKVLNLKERGDYCMIAVDMLGEMADRRIDTNGYITQYEFMGDRIMNNIGNLMRGRYQQDIVTKFDQTVLILHRLYQNDPEESYEELMATANWLSQSLGRLFFGMVFHIGIGTVEEGLEGVSASYGHALSAISYGGMIHCEENGYVISYHDSRLLKIFGKLRETGSLDEVIPENLLEIRKWDQKYNANLFDTLKTYLDCNCNAKKASEKMFIHYKTMLYRLEKIQKHFGVQLTDGVLRLQIELGIQMLDILDTQNREIGEK